MDLEPNVKNININKQKLLYNPINCIVVVKEVIIESPTCDAWGQALHKEGMMSKL